MIDDKYEKIAEPQKKKLRTEGRSSNTIDTTSSIGFFAKPDTSKVSENPILPPTIKMITSYTTSNSFYYHGVGLDLTKLTLISKHGILTANDGNKTLTTSFTQMHGVSEYSNEGGTNKKDCISVSTFDSTAFTKYNKVGISFMLSKTLMNKSLSSNTILGLIPGEKHIKGSISVQNIYGLSFPGSILKQSIGTGVGNSILEGSSLATFKVEGFLQRIATIFNGFSDEKVKLELMNSAKEIDDFYKEPIPNTASAHQEFKSKISDKKSKLAKAIDEYFAAGVKSVYSDIETNRDYLQHPDLNKFPLIVVTESAYDKPNVQTPRLTM